MIFKEFHFSHQIWQIFRDDLSKNFVLELKSLDKKENSIAVCSVLGEIKEFQLPNNQIYTLAAVSNGLILVHHFPDQNVPIPSGISVYDLSFNKLWEDVSLTILQVFKNAALVEKNKQKLYIDLKTSQILEHDKPEKLAIQGEFPILITTQDSEFKDWQAFFEELIEEKPVLQMEIYQKTKPLTTYAILYFVQNQHYRQELFILNNRDIVFRKILAEQLIKIPVDTCWIHEDCLVLLSNKTSVLLFSI